MTQCCMSGQELGKTGLKQYQLPSLPYDYNALEPVISEEIMKLHHQKHHQGYVTNLNKALEEYYDAEHKNDLPKMVTLLQAIKFNGGGNINHSIFWTNLAPEKNGGGGRPEGKLAEAINKDFGSFDKFVEQLTAKAVALQGSGWAWLGYNKANNKLEIATCDNQDPLSTKGLIPLLGIDVWEHAYYIDYKNVRADYVKGIWKIINWKNVAERFNQATSG
jgi:superoxide dismutase, Fe-Mn family